MMRFTRTSTVLGIAVLMHSAAAQASVTFSIEPLPGTQWLENDVVTVEVFVTSTTTIQIVGGTADLPCILPGLPGSSGSISAASPNPVFVGNASHASSGSIPWLWAPQGTCTAGPNVGGFCTGKIDCPQGACDTAAHNGGLRPIAQAACRFSGAPNAGESAYTLPANTKRYMGTVRYLVDECTSGEFALEFENHSEPCQITNQTRLVNQNNNCVNVTPFAPTPSAQSRSLYGDVEVGFGVVSLSDLLCILAGFLNADDCTTGDIYPCGGDGIIELGDVLAVLAAYNGEYLCPPPCP